MDSTASCGTEPVEDDREGAGLHAVVHAAAFGGQARADQQRGHLVEVDVGSHRTGLLGAGQKRSKRPE
jgi:hypothetical protein